MNYLNSEYFRVEVRVLSGLSFFFFFSFLNVSKEIFNVFGAVY